MNTKALLPSLALAFVLSSAQNIYDGCDSNKECLGFVKGMDDTQTTCLQTKVRQQRTVSLFLSHIKSSFQDCTLVLAYNDSTVDGYAHFEVMHADAGR